MPDVASSARESTLLISVPIDEQSFRSAWSRGSDYLRKAYTDVDLGWGVYNNIARLAQAVCRECEALGATVVTNATLADFARSAEKFPAIILIAHMEFPLVSSSDVLDQDELVRLVLQGKEPEWQMLRTEAQAVNEPEDIVDAINRLLRSTQRDLNSTPTKDGREAERDMRHRRKSLGLLRLDRPRIDELCGPTVLRPGRGVEMADQMITSSQFIGAIPLTHKGFLDLRMCNSISLGAAIWRARQHTRLAVGRRKTLLDGPLVLYKTALVAMAQAERIGRRRSYEETMTSLIEAAQ